MMRTFVVDAALVAAIVMVWRNPHASADVAGQALRWVDGHLRPMLSGVGTPSDP
jgi:hypothetical protein